MCLGLLRQEASRDGPDDETYDRADGVVKALGPDFEGERLNCMGHGDPYCRYKILWIRPSGVDST